LSDRSLPASYFDALYAADPDPWRFATSAYERDKYATTLRALPRLRYLSALEVGCSIGVLTHELAQRCELLLSIDASARPLAAARERCRDRPSARFAEMTVPRQWPEEEFDLILLSEVVYYLAADDVAHLARRVETSLAPRGDIVLVHWIGATNYPLSGDDASEIFLVEVSGFTSIVRQRRAERFRLDVLTRG
jgi:2-polyprenyl-3-methyl-5-hydroxy-6-metoxy-1,4-benzoquinol methylase